jgi:hypothetical protein
MLGITSRAVTAVDIDYIAIVITAISGMAMSALRSSAMAITIGVVRMVSAVGPSRRAATIVEPLPRLPLQLVTYAGCFLLWRPASP